MKEGSKMWQTPTWDEALLCGRQRPWPASMHRLEHANHAVSTGQLGLRRRLVHTLQGWGCHGGAKQAVRGRAKGSSRRAPCSPVVRLAQP